MHASSTETRAARRAILVTVWLLAGCAGAGSPPETGPAPATPAASAGFTEVQAERGRMEFGQVCGECHATSEFRGDDFQFRWRRRTAWDFYRNLVDTMPEDAPGSLTDRQYVDVIAYILSMNGFAAGESELEATEAALDRFVMDQGGGP